MEFSGASPSHKHLEDRKPGAHLHFGSVCVSRSSSLLHGGGSPPIVTVYSGRSQWVHFGFSGRNWIPGRETGDRRGGARILEEAGSTLGPPGRPRVAPTHHPNFSGKVAVPGTCCRKGTWNPSPAPWSKPWIGTSHSPVFQEPFWKFFLDISLELAWPESSRAGRGGLTSPGEVGRGFHGPHRPRLLAQVFLPFPG